MAGLIITIAQQKGGAGKTTLAAQLAVAWSRAGRRLAVLDIDPQKSLTAWVDQRRMRLGDAAVGFEFAALSGWRATEWVDRHARSAEIILIDSPPHAETEARISLRIASLVLVPVQPSPLDLWATQATLRLARDEKRAVLAALNRVPPRAALTEEIAAALAKDNVPIAATRIGNRTGFARAMASGLGVLETAPSSVAAAEIAALAAELSPGLGPGLGPELGPELGPGLGPGLDRSR
jgi:chromosome partitioning protein